MIVSTSSLHDVGKISIPDNVLLKPGKLTQEEYEYMKSHTTRGSEILSEFKDIWDDEYRKTSYEICRYHHERYDGRGYPDGLKGDEIPISAQIVSIADVYDALVSERVYKSAYTKDEAFHMIVTGECGVFSPKLLECFRNVKKDFEAL
jgi:putative two-component system response regulator